MPRRSNDLDVFTDQVHPRVMIYTIFVELETQMLHAKFQDPRPFGSGEEKFKGFC